MEISHDSIVIEGLGGAGKTTTARLLAARYGYANFNTGTLFRATAAAALQEHIIVPELGSYTEQAAYQIDLTDSLQPLLAVNGYDVSDLLQLPAATRIASYIGNTAAADRLESIFYQTLLNKQPMVVEGKNLSTKLATSLSHSFFLIASRDVRAYRKWQQAKQQGKASYTLHEAQIDTYLNDTRDRKLLQITPGAQLLDTTRLSPEQVVEIIYSAASVPYSDAIVKANEPRSQNP